MIGNGSVPCQECLDGVHFDLLLYLSFQQRKELPQESSMKESAFCVSNHLRLVFLAPIPEEDLTTHRKADMDCGPSRSLLTA